MPIAANTEGQAPPPVAEQRHLVLILGDVDGGGVRLGRRRGEDAPQELGADGVGGVWRAHVPQSGRPGRARPPRARGRRRPARRRSSPRASRAARGRARQPARQRRSPGAASSVLPTSPMAAVPKRADAAAAVPAAWRRNSRGVSPTFFRNRCAQAMKPPPPGTISPSPDSSRWQWAFTSPGSRAPSARSSVAPENSARTAPRGPTIRTVPSSSSATAPSEIGGPIDRDDPARADDPHRVKLRRRQAVRSACCGGAAGSRPRGCSVRCPRRRA